MAKTKKHEMHTYTADVQLVEQNGIYFIYKDGERYIGPILPHRRTADPDLHPADPLL